MNWNERILELLPYKEPFLFVDQFTEVSDMGTAGSFTFRPDLSFYRGHFPGSPITPGVILAETMAQIGLVGLGMFLMREDPISSTYRFVMTGTDINYRRAVFPGETVYVKSEKEYFRMGKLKARVKMVKESGEMACYGSISGMIIMPPRK
jgi:3-hydroxyacyl-[acyl-carrier-protein] dehydratase